jgi:nucleotide-binding universal stress UspA family protein
MSVFPTKVLLATDGSENAAEAARTAVELSNKTGSELHVVYVETDIPTFLAHMEIDPARISEQSKALLEEQVEKIEAAGGAVARAHLKTGNAAEQIVTLSEELRAGLVVIGSRGESVWKRAVMGSVTEDVVRHAHCPVLVVREEEPRT